MKDLYDTINFQRLVVAIARVTIHKPAQRLLDQLCADGRQKCSLLGTQLKKTTLEIFEKNFTAKIWVPLTHGSKTEISNSYPPYISTKA